MATVDLGSYKAEIVLDDSKFTSKMNAAERDLKSFESGAGKWGSRLGTLATGAIAGLGTALAGLGVVAGKTGIEFNAMVEQSQIGWETLLGSGEKAKEQIETLKELGARSPFEFEGLDQAAKLLNMAGFEGDKLTETLTNVGDAVSAVGGGQDELEGVSMALFQMSAKGKASAEEMNQLAERGIPAWEILSKSMGKSVPELMKMSEQGKLMADQVIPALVQGMGERFGGAMEKQSKTFNGMMSTLKDNLKMLSGELMQPVFDSIKKILPDVLNVLDGIINAIQTKGIKQAFLDMFNFGGGEGGGFLSVIQPLIDVFNNLKSYIQPAMDGVSSFVQSKLGELRQFWSENGSQIMEAVRNVFEIIKGIISAVMPVVVFLVQNAWNTVKSVISGSLDIIMGLVKVFSGLFTGDFSKMWEGIKQIFSGALETVWGLLNLNLTGKIHDVIVGFKDKAIDTFKNMVSGIKNWFEDLLSAAKSKFESIKNGIMTPINNAKDKVIEYISNLISNAKSKFGDLYSAASSKFNEIKNSIMNPINTAKTSVTNFILNMVSSAKTKFSDMFSAANSKFNEIKNSIMNPINTAKTNVTNFISNMVSSAKSKFDELYGKAQSIFNSIKKSMINPIESAKNTISGIINKIKSAFSEMKISIPKPKLPHIDVDWKSYGVGDMKVKVPTFDVSWYATGGIFDKPSIVGLAEQGREAILPLENPTYMAPFADAVWDRMRENLKNEKNTSPNQQNTIHFNPTFQFSVNGTLDKSQAEKIADITIERMIHRLKPYGFIQ